MLTDWKLRVNCKCSNEPGEKPAFPRVRGQSKEELCSLYQENQKGKSGKGTVSPPAFIPLFPPCVANSYSSLRPNLDSTFPEAFPDPAAEVSVPAPCAQSPQHTSSRALVTTLINWVYLSSWPTWELFQDRDHAWRFPRLNAMPTVWLTGSPQGISVEVTCTQPLTETQILHHSSATQARGHTISPGLTGSRHPCLEEALWRSGLGWWRG